MEFNDLNFCSRNGRKLTISRIPLDSPIFRMVAPICKNFRVNRGSDESEFKIDIILMNPISRVIQIRENEPHVAAYPIVTYANREIAFPILHRYFAVLPSAQSLSSP